MPRSRPLTRRADSPRATGARPTIIAHLHERGTMDPTRRQAGSAIAERNARLSGSGHFGLSARGTKRR